MFINSFRFECDQSANEGYPNEVWFSKFSTNEKYFASASNDKSVTFHPFFEYLTGEALEGSLHWQLIVETSGR